MCAGRFLAYAPSCPETHLYITCRPDPTPALPLHSCGSGARREVGVKPPNKCSNKMKRAPRRLRDYDPETFSPRYPWEFREITLINSLNTTKYEYSRAVLLYGGVLISNAGKCERDRCVNWCMNSCTMNFSEVQGISTPSPLKVQEGKR